MNRHLKHFKKNGLVVGVLLLWLVGVRCSHSTKATLQHPHEVQQSWNKDVDLVLDRVPCNRVLDSTQTQPATNHQYACFLLNITIPAVVEKAVQITYAKYVQYDMQPSFAAWQKGDSTIAGLYLPIASLNSNEFKGVLVFEVKNNLAIDSLTCFRFLHASTKLTLPFKQTANILTNANQQP